MESLIIIPARMESKRLPGKPLALCGRKTLLEHTYAQASKVEGATVFVTSSDDEVLEHCEKWGMRAVRSAAGHLNGTQRCAEVAEILARDRDYGNVVVNWQVDEPLADVGAVAEMIRLTVTGISTLVARPTMPDEFIDRQDVVKVAYNNGRCLYFSRAPMRGACVHVGIYAFKAASLFRAARQPISYLAQAEGLEQLSWLEAGFVIRGVGSRWLPAVNTETDLEAFRVACGVAGT